MKRKHILGLAGLLTLIPVAIYFPYPRIYNPSNLQGKAFLTSSKEGCKRHREKIIRIRNLDDKMVGEDEREFKKWIEERDQAFKEYIESERIPDTPKYQIVMLFSIENYTPCKTLYEALKQQEKKYKDLKIIKFDTDEETKKKFKINDGVPITFYLEEGLFTGMLHGCRPAKKEWLEPRKVTLEQYMEYRTEGEFPDLVKN